METLQVSGYTEVVPLPEFGPAVLNSILQSAINSSGWFVLNVHGDTIHCQTPPADQSEGDFVSLVIEQKTITLHVRPINEYYWQTDQERKTATIFRQAMELAIAAHQTANRNMHPMHREKYGALVISKSYVVTPIIVYANALIFVAMVLAGVSPLQPVVSSLYDWGGNFGPAVAGGQWWRLITYMFLHGGGFHLLGNTFALLYIGMFLEPLLGKFRFASAYLLTGVCAGLLSILLHDNTVSVGASGAIFGMYGVFLSVLTTSHIQRTMRRTMLRSILFFVVFNLMMGLQGNTDNAAHIGGLISGFIIGYVYYPGIAKQAGPSRQIITSLVISIVVVLLSIVTLMYKS